MKPKDLHCHTPGALTEIDPDLMPGLYELDLPDELLEVGSHRMTLMVRAPSAAPAVIHFDLVGYESGNARLDDAFSSDERAEWLEVHKSVLWVAERQCEVAERRRSGEADADRDGRALHHHLSAR